MLASCRNAKFAAWAAILAVVINLATSALALSVAALSSQSADPLGPLVICSEHGLVTVEADRENHAPAPKSPHCAFCLAAHSPSPALPAFAGLHVEFAVPTALEWASEPRIARTRISLFGLGSRGPPPSLV